MADNKHRRSISASLTGARLLPRARFARMSWKPKNAKPNVKRTSKRHAIRRLPAAARRTTAARSLAADAPKASPAFENLIRMIGSNAAMVLGAYADPRTGQPVIDPEAARELIDMLDVLQEKTKGHLAPEEDSLLVDLLGKLKMTFLEVNQALAAQAAKVAQQAKVGAKR